MRLVIQRVSRASVTIDGKVKSAIGRGYLILIGIEETDNEEDIDWLVKKVIGLMTFGNTFPSVRCWLLISLRIAPLWFRPVALWKSCRSPAISTLISLIRSPKVSTSSKSWWIWMVIQK